MKKHMVLFLVLCINFLSGDELLAQPLGTISGLAYYPNAQVFTLKANTLMSKKAWNHVIYRFPEFQEASIIFKEGAEPSKKLLLNFNIMDERVEIIAAKGDTIDFKNLNEIKSIKVGKSIFLKVDTYPRGFVEKLNEYPVSLGAMHFIKGMYKTNSGQMFALRNISAGSAAGRYDELYVRKESYFFINPYGGLSKATFPAILKLFPQSKSEIKKFIRHNKINFGLKNDLLQLLDFCNQLGSGSQSAQLFLQTRDGQI